MKQILNIFLLLAVVSCVFSACKQQKKSEDIIVDRVIDKPQGGPIKMEPDERSASVSWINGQEYSYTITRHASDSLAMVENHGEKYYDNAIRLVVYRSDGTVFFQKTFTKANFSNILPAEQKKSGVLLGMSLDKAAGGDLRFVVSVGSPDDSNEEFYNVLMVLDSHGATRAEEYKSSVIVEEE